MSDTEPKVGDVVCEETGPLGTASHGATYAHEYDAVAGKRREIVWRECSGEFPRKFGRTYFRLESIGEWK